MCLLCFFLVLLGGDEVPSVPTIFEQGPEPSDWLYCQRAYPTGKIDRAAYYSAIRQKQRTMDLMQQSRTPMPTWEYRGPDNIGGRITDLAIHPSDHNTIYAGAASGGLFKTTDRGQTWQPIFDDALSLSIGDLDIAATNPNVLYVGTGEANAGGGSLTYDGTGVYKSTDAGTTWQHCGLTEAGSIGRLVIHPQDTAKVYVAAMGHMFANNPERGIYRTEDGGQTWENILFVSDSTGGVEIAVHPTQPDTLYAAMWERIRRPGYRQYGGPSSGIYRSYDGGDTWTLLTSGLPTQDLGRIGLAISPSQPSQVYAVVIDPIGELIDVYKTMDNGDNWQVAGSAGANTPSFMWWFGRVFADPLDADRAYLASLDMYESQNGGANWSKISHGVHVDQHALYIAPDTSGFMVIGCDGGVYISENHGQNWTHQKGLPITQFYECEIDPSFPDRLYGGTQDNGTMRVLDNDPGNWKRIWGGDGFVSLVDPDDNSYVYVESQYGNLRRAVNGGTNFQYAQSGLANGGRNWNTPYVFDPQDPSILYIATRRVYKSTNRAAFWTPISPDLATAPGGNNLVYGTFTSLSVSPLSSNIIFAGTDDGHLWRTTNGGMDWTEISAGIPDRWITEVVASPHDSATVFVSLSGFQHDDEAPHLWKSTDFGDTWMSCSGNLPPIPINCVHQDPDNPHQLYVANDAGVYASYTSGQSWFPLGVGLPNVIVNDLDFHPGMQTLVAATYGRSMYSLVLPPVDVQPVPLTGQVRKENGVALDSFAVRDLMGGMTDVLTDSAGQYSFADAFSGSDYELQPRRNDDHLNGVSTFDLVLISRHVLGVQLLDSPYKIIAADVNNTGHITTLDIIKLRRLILSLDTELEHVESWRFVPADYQFPNTANPWQELFPTSITVSGLSGDGLLQQDFIAIKMGDVNLDAE